MNRYAIMMTDHYGGFTWGTTCADKVADNLVTFVQNVCVNVYFYTQKILVLY